MTPDIINAIFEWAAGCFIWANVVKLQQDKMVRGVHWLPVGFFALWGFWNLYFYPSLDQWMSFYGGIMVVFANTVWFGQMVYYTMREKRFRSAVPAVYGTRQVDYRTVEQVREDIEKHTVDEWHAIRGTQPPCPDCGCGMGMHYSTCIHRIDRGEIIRIKIRDGS